MFLVVSPIRSMPLYNRAIRFYTGATAPTIMDDLRSDSESAFFSEEDKVLVWIGNGKYCLKEAAASDSSEAAVLAEEPKPSFPDEVNVKLESVVASFFDKLKLALNQPTYRFATVSSSRVPAEPGVYVIHDESSKKLIYAGKSKNLRVPLIQQHKQGNIRGSQFRKALRQKYSLGGEAEISAYIRDCCRFQFLPMESFEEMARLENFIVAIMAPILNTELKQ